MDIALKIKDTDFAASEVRNTLTYALHSETEQAQLRRDHYAEICKTFEQNYRQSSDEFLIQFEQGILGDELYTLAWFAAKRGLDLWDRLSYSARNFAVNAREYY
ncbi:hypothetical protein BH10CHL1_BH10CHL1_00530 [soil metagenome]